MSHGAETGSQGLHETQKCQQKRHETANNEQIEGALRMSETVPKECPHKRLTH